MTLTKNLHVWQFDGHTVRLAEAEAEADIDHGCVITGEDAAAESGQVAR